MSSTHLADRRYADTGMDTGMDLICLFVCTRFRSLPRRLMALMSHGTDDRLVNSPAPEGGSATQTRHVVFSAPASCKRGGPEGFLIRASA
jgi:hypothetical protein